MRYFAIFTTVLLCMVADAQKLSLTPAEDVAVRSSVVDPATYPKEADYLLLSCVDFRLQDEIENFMQNRGLIDQYDHVELPGAALGVDNVEKPEWRQTFDDALSALKDLHQIQGVMVMDHRSCGMYNVVYGRDVSQDKVEEYALHEKHLKSVKAMLKDQYPDLKVELLLMNLDGTVQTVEGLS